MMNINLATAIANRVTNITPVELMKMSFRDVALKVILPKLAGESKWRERIQPQYMAFMADWGGVCLEEDADVGAVLYEIAMQRLSNGAVLHEDDPTPTFKALPEEYRDYGSQNYYKGGEPGTLGKDCADFILKQIEICMRLPQYGYHAKAICFGLVRHLRASGDTLDGYYAFGAIGFKPDGQRFYKLAHDMVMKYATDEERFVHWATPTQWQRHLHYFARKWQDGELDFKRFLKAIGATEGGFIKRWKQRRWIVSLFKQAELPKGCVAVASR